MITLEESLITPFSGDPDDLVELQELVEHLVLVSDIFRCLIQEFYISVDYSIFSRNITDGIQEKAKVEQKGIFILFIYLLSTSSVRHCVGHCPSSFRELGLKTEIHLENILRVQCSKGRLEIFTEYPMSTEEFT